MGGWFGDSLPNSALLSGAYDTLGQSRSTPNDVTSENAQNVVCLPPTPAMLMGFVLPLSGLPPTRCAWTKERSGVHQCRTCPMTGEGGESVM